MSQCNQEHIPSDQGRSHARVARRWIRPESISLPGPLRILRDTTITTVQRPNVNPRASGFHARSRRSVRLHQARSIPCRTRPDVVGPKLADALGSLRDRLPPFPGGAGRSRARDRFRKALDRRLRQFGPPVAAASIAQVHKASVRSKDSPHAVAVKILRPGIERRFERDLESFYFAAHAAERFSPQTRGCADRRGRYARTIRCWWRWTCGLRRPPFRKWRTISRGGDRDFRVPGVDWERTAPGDFDPRMDRRHAPDRPGGRSRQVGPRPPGARDSTSSDPSSSTRSATVSSTPTCIRETSSRTRTTARLIAVDFGIMGRIGPRSAVSSRKSSTASSPRIITDREVHFEAGYVPASRT